MSTEIEIENDNYVTVLDEVEQIAKFQNEIQNHEEPESVCPDILNELGADYFRNDEIQMKKYKKNKEDRNAIYRSLNKRQKEIFVCGF